MQNCSTRLLLVASLCTLSLCVAPVAISGGKTAPPLSDLPPDMRGEIHLVQQAKPQQAVQAQQQQQQQVQQAPGQVQQRLHPDVIANPGADPEPDDIVVKPAPLPADVHAPLIQVAILLDTSNSMDGLIDQAKAQLWMIVNRFAKAQREGQDPNFQIALFEYGNTNLPAEEGYIRQIVPFTNDLDTVSTALFALRTRGGDEYCGQVIDEALTRLPWSSKPNDFKAIYIAGNEPFTQGNVHYVGVCKRARDKQVLVNTIHCGPEHKGIAGKWQHGAHLTGGSFLTINQDRSVVHPRCPQDDELRALNTRLNTTYIPYGAQGKRAAEQQVQADTANAGLSADAEASRIVTKGGKLYYNAHWDLVDASGEKEFDLAKIEDKDLPEAMRGKTLAEKKAYIAKMKAERAKIQAAIAKLAAERAEFIAKDRAKKAKEEGESLGEAVNGTVDEQLEKSGFKVEQKQAE